MADSMESLVLKLQDKHEELSKAYESHIETLQKQNDNLLELLDMTLDLLATYDHIRAMRVRKMLYMTQ